MVAAALGSLAAVAVSPSGAAAPATGHLPPGRWHRIFHATFPGSRLDTKTWSTCFDWACTNAGENELEWYTPANAVVKDGELDLTAEPRTTPGPKPYLSGMVQSNRHFSFRYGYAEIDAQVPAGVGFWSAFWLLPTSHNPVPEIDVVEIYGDAPRTAALTLHEVGGKRLQTMYTGPDFSAGFHRFAVDWEPHSISWYVDGKLRMRERVSVSARSYLLANLAINGDTPPTASTVFPSAMRIRSITVWQHPGS